MNERVIHLEDGSTVEAKVNFATLYYMEKFKVQGLINKIEDDKENNGHGDDEDNIELMAKMLHVILMSNGRTCTFEEALVLLPLDDIEFEEVLEDFKEKIEDYKKKQESRRKMTEFTKNLG